MAVPGAAAAMRISRSSEMFTSHDESLMSCPTSAGCRMSAAASVVLPRSGFVAHRWVSTMPQISAATETAFMWAALLGGHLAAVARDKEWLRDFAYRQTVIKRHVKSAAGTARRVRGPARSNSVELDDAIVAAAEPDTASRRLHAR